MRILLVGVFSLIQIALSMAQVKTINKEINGLTFICRVAGDPKNEPVILLHGWPETSHMWVRLMEQLSAEGYYCVAPDQRGFSPDARPEKVKEYAIQFLVNDVVGLADAFGFEKFHLIGHDWGSAIGWAVVNFHANRVKSWTAMSVPHIRAFSDAIRYDKKQREMSRYMALFQWRGIPEWYLLKNDRENLRKMWKKSTPEELQEYLNVIGNKPALKATLGYYRANYKMLKKGKDAALYGDVETPTLLLWGKKDIAIGPVGIAGTAVYMKGPYQRIDLNAGHWLMQETLEECHSAIRTHLSTYN